MKNELVLHNNPFSGIFFSGLLTIAFTVSGLAITYSALPRNFVFSCNRIAANNPSCNFKENELWLGIKQETFLEQINAAIVATLSGESNDDQYFVKLKTDYDNFTLIGYNSEDQAQSIASQINSFITNKTQNSFQLEFSTQLKVGPLLMGLLFFSLGMGLLILIIVIPYYRNITFDKITNKILIQHKGFLKNKLIEHKLSEVVEVIKEDKIDKSDDTTTSYLLLMSGGERISLSSYYGQNWKSELEMVENLAAFLNLKITHQQIKV
ncbi:hypothetical protein H6G54_15255 [Anabaena cylindrica FACHB-243]|uniref:Uncharacterized protein n=1 Tax=Anabaena cylindrica (strain ATCC 27899 / PCC 7122) TaxID=272123 RepID=K9ZN09_ANACC|nr:MULTISPECIES: hypothetical protein [Anabaena]AFZ59937.1 hypothetical protein Anacy_4585 [Anabaena cylindrica PCC 7122]MBD2419030.1 hypothetical protein [Anabaena cylindrica FACHB-243]MBY5282688.1 hypothetical protein [Anabaena sp. CCAP 1446/1C]MBY5307564.1 hypothetical protein [Anabaena sp. CCAP 1446/1C]MCM2407840.1 hypothetical protein [Anabaena sp. CCAP 1446/1C]